MEWVNVMVKGVPINEYSIKRTKRAILKFKGSNFIKRFNQSKYLLLLFLPCFLYFVIFRYLPIYGLVIAFKNYKIFAGFNESPWVGFKYFKMFFESPDSLIIVRNTILLGLNNLFWGFPAPIIFALVLNEVRNMAFKRTVQTISYLPYFMSPVVVVGMVIAFLSPRNGTINNFIVSLGGQPINFLMEPGLFRPIYVCMGIWQNMGWGAILYLAALSSIDPTLYEAANIDGANKLRQIWHVTLPGITPTIVTLFILDTGQLLEIGFEKVFLLYNPAIYSTADVVSTYVYRIGLINSNFSYATAIGMSMSVISLIFISISNYLSRKLGDTSLW
jgi:putative aldouronate transport system permease protein